jgi:DNA invertase Pin-like site-specific DNA recombinase
MVRAGVLRLEVMFTLPCAVYTRKSSEEGLDQDFNSLDAQREACEAFILSQKTQGWKRAGCYDDGGFSGGNVDRPGLQRLLADIRAKRIKVVVVYKVDRLTRSLADFAKMVELFDAHEVSFVSVTQQFNTTTSMGRLTLNVLLSFAQFEREVTGERIRDKIAASKRKGMWMGGFAPIGYVPHERTLAVDEPRAQRVRDIFDLYLRLGSVRHLKLELDARGWKTPEREGKRPGGGRSFSRGHLYRLLSNPIYVGEISHKGVVHPGQHQAIVARHVWEAVQAGLAENAQGHSERIDAVDPSLLAGLLQDDRGRPLRPTHAKKGSKRYRYYYAQTASEDDESTLRIPAQELEKAVVGELIRFLRDEPRLLAAVPSLGATETRALFVSAASRARLLEGSHAADRIRTVRELVSHVVVGKMSLEIGVRESGLRDVQTPQARVFAITFAAQLKRGNHATRLVVRGATTEARVPDAGLVALLARSNRWFRALLSGRHDSIMALAKVERQAGRDITRTIYLAFLAPDIVERFVRGEQPIGLGVRRLMAMSPLPMDWGEQRRALGLT